MRPFVVAPALLPAVGSAAGSIGAGKRSMHDRRSTTIGRTPGAGADYVEVHKGRDADLVTVVSLIKTGEEQFCCLYGN